MGLIKYVYNISIKNCCSYGHLYDGASIIIINSHIILKTPYTPYNYNAKIIDFIQRTSIRIKKKNRKKGMHSIKTISNKRKRLSI